MTSRGARRSVIAVASASLGVSLAGCAGRSDAPRAKSAATAFNADSAMSYVRQQLAFGPRVPGTAGARKTGDWIVARLKATADTVLEQAWTATTSKGEKLPLRNIFARFRPQAAERVLYVTHWDTRPVADSESDSAKRKLPIPGANDGASGVALLLAVADALKKAPPGVGVDLLFVDGEDYGVFGPPDVDVLMGSTYFAGHMPSPDYKPLFGVLWDMIGDADLQIYQEVNSVQGAPEVVQRVWEKAKELGYEKYVIPEAKYGPITDDHVPLIKAGLRVIDVIDIDYECHHKLCDEIDKVSAKSLGIVGDLALALVMK
ncbi:MAG TPA: M28 family peptidase [Gemmatimonadaceae bacterium]|nr:M28 family peptidase [Gemmatimonadaceae bacterium]